MRGTVADIDTTRDRGPIDTRPIAKGCMRATVLFRIKHN